MSSSNVISDQLERLALAGFVAPTGEKLALMVGEWTRALAVYEDRHVLAGFDWVIEHRTDRWWPTLGEVLAAIRAAMGPKPEAATRCQSCEGSGWIEAVPFHAMQQTYEAMRRCPDCGIPAPDYTAPKGTRQPLTASEHRQWIQQRPVPLVLTEAQFFERLRALGAAQLAERWQTLPADAPHLRRALKVVK